MKNKLLASLLAVGLVSTSFAGITTGDLIMGFRDDGTANGGTGVASNVQADLGAFSNYATGGSFAAGGTIDTGINVGALLGSTYGSSYASDTGLFWGVVGTNGNTPTTRSLYVSAVGTSVDGPTSTAWIGKIGSTQSSQAAKFINVGSSSTAGAAAVVANNATNSWSVQETNTAASFGTFSKTAFEAVSGSAFADLYAVAPVAGQAGAFIGTFSISSVNGDVLFTTAAIPEPSVYAAILGVATLGFAAIRRRKQALVA